MALLTLAVLAGCTQGTPRPLAPATVSKPSDGGAAGPLAHMVAFVTSGPAGSPIPWQAFDGSNIVVADVARNGALDLVASNDNLRHYIIDPRAGLVLAQLNGTHVGGDTWLGRELDGPAVGDALGDNTTSIAIDDGAGYLSLWHFNAARSTSTHFGLDKLWEHLVDARELDPAFNLTHPWNVNDTPASEAHPYIAAVDGTGPATIFAQSDNVAIHAAYYANGTLRWFTDPAVDSNAGVIVTSLTPGGAPAAIFASDGGPVYAQDARTGSPLWSFDTRCAGGVWLDNGTNCDWNDVASVTLSPTVTDLFGDGNKEICFGSRTAVSPDSPLWNDNATAAPLIEASHANLYCLTHDGHLLWQQQLRFGNPHIAMHGVPFDVNGDGVKDMIWEDWNTIGHRPGNWQTTQRGPNLFALDGRDGHLLWNVSLVSAWSNKDVSLADIFGDGRQLLVAEEYGPTGGDGLRVIDPQTGARLGWIGLMPGWSATRGPIVADLDHNGTMSLIVPMMRNAPASWCAQVRPDLACREGAIEILAVPHPYSAAFSDNLPWSSR
ncbi:MAG: hypothetical protein ACYDBQ_02900 [Thermoplasmatota archaeon]